MTDQPTVAPPHPDFYLRRAQTQARSIRSWINRHGKEIDPDALDSVTWVLGVFDDLDKCIAGAMESADFHLPWTAALRAKQSTDPAVQAGLNRHRLKVAGDTAVEMARWVSSARWSEGVKPGDLDRLESLVRRLAEHVNHLNAQAQEQDLAR